MGIFKKTLSRKAVNKKLISLRQSGRAIEGYKVQQFLYMSGKALRAAEG